MRNVNDQTTHATQAVKPAGKKIKAAALITAIISLMIAGFFIGVIATSTPVKDKMFFTDDMSITLTTEFQSEEIDGFMAAYSTVDVAVFIRKASFETNPQLSQYSLARYAQEVYEFNGHDVPKGVQTRDDLTFYEYQHKNPDDGITYWYFTYVYKTDKGFWMVQFSTSEMEVENYRESITKWAKSVKFTDAKH